MDVSVSASASLSQSPSRPLSLSLSPSASFFSQIEYVLYLSISKSAKGQLFRIQVSVLLTVILLVALFFLGRLRRFVQMGWKVRSLTRIIYLVIPIALMYEMGLMHNASTFHILYPVWACSLIYAYGGVTTMTACNSLSDNDDTLSYTWRTLPLLFWTIWLALIVSNNRHAFPYMLVATVLVFLCVAARNTWETLEAFYLASKFKGLPGLVEPLVQYMSEEREMPTNLTSTSLRDTPTDLESSPIKGYRYLVWGNPSLPDGPGNSITTTNEIWESVGNNPQLQPELAERLKDVCLSYAFFRLILRRFADCPLHESSQQRTRRFVREGLLSNFEEEPLRVSQRVFDVIEVELAFLFDFFYTKSYVCSSHKWTHINMWIPLFYSALLLSFGTAGISYLVALNANSREQRNFNVKFFGHSLEVGITRIVTLVFSTMEFWKFLAVSFSNRKMVWLLSNPNVSMTGRMTEKVIVYMWILKDYLCRKCVFLSRPWKRKLGQYSFLESYGRDPILAHRYLSWFAKLVKVPRAGQDGEYSVQLSTEVKQAVVRSLLQYVQDEEKQLSKGMTTAGRHDLSFEIRRVCLVETDARLVLVWSIATSFCKLHFQPPQNPNEPNFLVAVQLSEYCSYLVCFAPELLNGRAYDTECVFNSAVRQAREVRGWELSEGYQSLIDRNLVDLDVNILGMGAKLASALEEQFMDSPDRMWLVLAEFWAELLLFLAPSNNVAAHGEYLARGGEFITHVWALLAHSGIVHRESS